MTRILLLTSLTLLAACGRGADQTQEIEALKRRVTSLERRISELSPEAKKPAKPAEGAEAAKGEAKAEPDPEAEGAGKAVVSATGDAVEVQLMRGKRKVSLPATVPPGEYTVQAVFAEGQPATPAGTITLTAGQQLSLECKADTKTCTPK